VAPLLASGSWSREQILGRQSRLQRVMHGATNEKSLPDGRLLIGTAALAQQLQEPDEEVPHEEPQLPEDIGTVEVTEKPDR